MNDDYQVHVIYLLTKDSKDKKLDVKGKIEKIVLKGNKHLNKRVNKHFKYDIIKEDKVDISFLRVGKTKKEISKLNPYPIDYFGTQIVKMVFIIQKKSIQFFIKKTFIRKNKIKMQKV